MRELFLQIVNMSLTALWLILAVMLVRLLLHRAPKWIPVLLWAIVALRLICPFSIHRSIAACPPAFGEIGVKERVKSVLSY